MSNKVPVTDNRTLQRIRAHYKIEKELAERLRKSSKEERKYLYSFLYDELFKRVPDHPQLTRKLYSKESNKRLEKQMTILRGFLNPETIFLEVGSGDCSLSLEVAKYVRKVYAVDVAREITKNVSAPKNVELILSDGSSIPVPENNINMAYSNQLMEHLHPDDAIEQLQNIYKALIPGGFYICVTPNRLSGPHDISRYFDKVARGFHLNEYTNTELIKVFRKVGFSKTDIIENGKKISKLFTIKMCESILAFLPHSLREKVIESLSLSVLKQIVIVGTK